MTSLIRRCWPGEEHELLLKAALLEDPSAVGAWQRWQTKAVPQKLDEGSKRLLPLLYHNLTRLNVNHPTLTQLKKLHRQTWFDNQILFHRAEELVQTIHEAGIPTLILKGAPLALLYYKDIGERPMADIDVLVPTRYAIQTIEHLHDLNWKSVADFPNKAINDLVAVRHSHGFVNLKGNAFDLHWHVLRECCGPNDDDEFWEKAIPVVIGTVETRTLCPADQLLHVCVHGAKFSHVPSFRWVADAVTLLRTAGSSVDWIRLVAQAKRRRLNWPMLDSLTYLKEVFEAPIPQWVLSQLLSNAAGRYEKLEYRALTHKIPALGGFPVDIFEYLRLVNGTSMSHKVSQFPTFLKCNYGLHSMGELPRQLWRKAVTRIRSN